jgi:1-acyl-sn-glycerol-3-phosphate acyltransferase
MTRSTALLTGAPADFDERDPEFIRANLPLWWLLATVYHRAEVEGFEHVPDRPVLFVGNHSGGAVSPDTIIFLLAHATYFGVERPMYALGHVMATSLPVLGNYVRRLGIVTAAPTVAQEAFDRDASVLVYPGGDVETFRPWTRRHRIEFAGRQGFLRTAYDAGVPIVPVVADGGHDTLFVLTDGRRLASALKFDKMLRVKSVPLVLAPPWGVSVGDWLLHWPLPAKIRIRVLEPIDLRERYGDTPDYDDAYAYVTSKMQAELSRLAARRVFPPFR